MSLLHYAPRQETRQEHKSDITLVKRASRDDLEDLIEEDLYLSAAKLDPHYAIGLPEQGDCNIYDPGPNELWPESRVRRPGSRFSRSCPCPRYGSHGQILPRISQSIM